MCKTLVGAFQVQGLGGKTKAKPLRCVGHTGSLLQTLWRGATMAQIQPKAGKRNGVSQDYWSVLNPCRQVGRCVWAFNVCLCEEVQNLTPASSLKAAPRMTSGLCQDDLRFFPGASTDDLNFLRVIRKDSNNYFVEGFMC